MEKKVIVDELSPQQLAHLRQFIREIKEGKVVEHETVKRMSRGWLSK